MRNFLRIASNVDPCPLLHQLATREDLWGKYPVRVARQDSAHHGLQDIILRYSPFSPGDDFLAKVCCDITPVCYPPWSILTAAHPILFGIMQRVCGLHLGRVMISRLPPGHHIPEHSDRIAQAEILYPAAPRPASYFERYHAVLQSGPGTVFRCGDEEIYMAPGEVWWFNNELAHKVVNNSAVDRIHLIADIRTKWDEYAPWTGESSK
jgi:hypothetical protein